MNSNLSSNFRGRCKVSTLHHRPAAALSPAEKSRPEKGVAILTPALVTSGRIACRAKLRTRLPNMFRFLQGDVGNWWSRKADSISAFAFRRPGYRCQMTLSTVLCLWTREAALAELDVQVLVGFLFFVLSPILFIVYRPRDFDWTWRITSAAHSENIWTQIFIMVERFVMVFTSSVIEIFYEGGDWAAAPTWPVCFYTTRESTLQGRVILAASLPWLSEQAHPSGKKKSLVRGEITVASVWWRKHFSYF